MKIKTLENEYSEIYDLFYFMQVDQVINKTNKILNNLPSWQCQLSLPLPQKTKNNLIFIKSIALDAGYKI